MSSEQPRLCEKGLLIARLCLASLAMLLLFLGVAGTAQAADTPEQQVKAAFICKFAQYVEWPATAFAQPSTPIVIGEIGSAAVAAELNALCQGMVVNGRPLVVRHLTAKDPVFDVHILFVGRDEDRHVQALLALTRTKPVLTITESELGLASGSIINFLLLNQRVHFEISTEMADANGLKLSARLLSVARNIRMERPQ